MKYYTLREISKRVEELKLEMPASFVTIQDQEKFVRELDLREWLQDFNSWLYSVPPSEIGGFPEETLSLVRIKFRKLLGELEK